MPQVNPEAQREAEARWKENLGFWNGQFSPLDNPVFIDAIWVCICYNHTIHNLCLLVVVPPDAGNLSLADWRDLVNVTWEHSVVSMVILTADTPVLFIHNSEG